ncbi:hypothetical protein FHX15_000622 [Rhizobium sp. BK650]|nr:hypothetical protein [Rhizobium sp. BK650]
MLDHEGFIPARLRLVLFKPALIESLFSLVVERFGQLLFGFGASVKNSILLGLLPPLGASLLLSKLTQVNDFGAHARPPS